MMSLHVAPRRAEPVAGIVAFSGRLIAPERLAADALSKPPVLLIHGDADEATLKHIGEQVRDELSNLPEISQVEVMAVRPYEIAIEVSDNVVSFTDDERSAIIATAVDCGLEVHGEVGSKSEESSAAELIAQANGCFGRSDGNDDDGKDLARYVVGGDVAPKGNQIDVDRIQTRRAELRSKNALKLRADLPL